MTDIEEAISYIESTEKHLRHLGESWYADYLSDAIDLLKYQKEAEPDYKKYIPIEWLQKYATLCCTFDMNKTAIHFVDAWFKMHEMCCCEKKDEAVE